MGFMRLCYSWTNRTFSRLTMQIGGTISEIHLKNTHFTYTVAAPAPQNTPDCGNRVNTPASVKCRLVSQNYIMSNYTFQFIVYTQAGTHRPYKRKKETVWKLKLNSRYVTLCPLYINTKLIWIIHRYCRFAGPLSPCGKCGLDNYLFWFHRIYIRNR